ncbi:MAG: FAD-dependent oxidoreductase, partial [Candidatus Limnocylindrales bacterium]
MIAPRPAYERRVFWHTTVPRPVLRQQGPLERADVVVIGAGYTGLNAALRLARGGARVVVLEKGLLGHGASSRNAGQVHGGLRY